MKNKAKKTKETKETKESRKRTMAARMLAIILVATMVISSMIYILILIGDKE